MNQEIGRPDVFMPLYIGDYLAGTSRLTTELHGAYLLLIMDYWMNGPLPNNDQALAAITRMTPDAWSIAQASLKHYFIITQASWAHKRVEEELHKAGAKKRKSIERAEKAAAARWGNGKLDATGNATSNAQALLEECPSPSPSPSPIVIKEIVPQASPKRATRLPSEWQLTDEYYQAALDICPAIGPRLNDIAATYKDYWIAKSGQAATKADWLATWRNWIRREAQNAKSGSNAKKSYGEQRADLYDAVVGNYKRATDF